MWYILVLEMENYTDKPTVAVTTGSEEVKVINVFNPKWTPLVFSDRYLRIILYLGSMSLFKFIILLILVI